jgi:hypothetical protein
VGLGSHESIEDLGGEAGEVYLLICFSTYATGLICVKLLTFSLLIVSESGYIANPENLRIA